MLRIITAKRLSSVFRRLSEKFRGTTLISLGSRIRVNMTWESATKEQLKKILLVNITRVGNAQPILILTKVSNLARTECQIDPVVPWAYLFSYDNSRFLQDLPITTLWKISLKTGQSIPSKSRGNHTISLLIHNRTLPRG